MKTEMNINIKKINAHETYDLRHEVMWPDMPREFVILNDDKNAIHFGLSKDSELISIVSLFINGNSAQFRKFATKTSEQGNGYGSLLLNHLITYVETKKISKLWCNARIDKTLFYERFGMYKTPKRFIKEGIEYVIMEKTFEGK